VLLINFREFATSILATAEIYRRELVLVKQKINLSSKCELSFNFTFRSESYADSASSGSRSKALTGVGARPKQGVREPVS